MSSIRKKTSNFIVWVILLLLIAGLGGFGISNFGGSTAAIATVGKTEVDMNEYYRALQQELRVRAQSGQPIPLSVAIANGLDQYVRAGLITGATLDNEADRIGLSIGDARVKTEILAMSDFQGLDGSFDRSAYRFALEQSGLNEVGFENNIRTETARTILQSAILGGIAAPDAMRDSFLDFTLERRNFAWIRLDQNALPELVPEPTDAQLQAYYQANAADFTEPEKKRLSYVWVTPDMIVDQIKVSEDDLRKEYNKRLPEYSKPERRLVERLIFPSSDDIATAKARLDAGEATFEELAIQRGLTLLDIDLGDVTIQALGDAGDAVFAMTSPGVIGPIETDFGPALYRMNGILAAQETTFDEVRAQLQDELALDSARRQILASITDIDDLLAGGATLAEIAQETDMKQGQIDWAEGQSDGIAAYNAFRKAALAVTDGDYAEALELDDGGIFAVEFGELIAPALNPIDTVMSNVISGWENHEIETRLTTMAGGLVERLGKGEDIASLGYTVNFEVDIQRNANIEGAPFGMVGTLFTMDKGTAQTIDGSGVVFVVRLDDILPPDAENPDLPAIKARMETEISQALAQDIFAAFNGALQNQAGVTVNSAAINAVHSQFPQ